jgi:Periplasmic binding protein
MCQKQLHIGIVHKPREREDVYEHPPPIHRDHHGCFTRSGRFECGAHERLSRTERRSNDRCDQGRGPYVDFAALAALGVKLTQGSYPDAYKALIANMNAHGGINGRRIVPFFAPVNPTGTAATLAACTQLTGDDNIFAALGPYMPNCYLEQKNTPTVGATTTAMPTSTPNFTLIPPPSAYDPLQLSVFSKMGLFKNKKVAIFAGAASDASEMTTVQKTLKGLHVKVVQSAVDSALASDQVASDQQANLIALRFKDAGANEVVAVGTGSSVWPAALLANQSTYNPDWIATDETALSGYVGGTTANGATTYLKGVVTSAPVPTSEQAWKDPAVKQCVQIIKKAFPADTITSPSLASNSSDHSYISAQQACLNVAMFDKIASAAGKTLTVRSFARAGYGLRHVTFPGSGGPVSFAPNRAYAIGPV